MARLRKLPNAYDFLLEWVLSDLNLKSEAGPTLDIYYYEDVASNLLLDKLEELQEN